MQSRESPALFAVSLEHRHDELPRERRRLFGVVDFGHGTGHKFDAPVWFNEKRGPHRAVLYGSASGMTSTVISKEIREVDYSKGRREHEGVDLQDCQTRIRHRLTQRVSAQRRDDRDQGQDLAHTRRGTSSAAAVVAQGKCPSGTSRSASTARWPLGPAFPPPSCVPEDLECAHRSVRVRELSALVIDICVRHTSALDVTLAVPIDEFLAGSSAITGRRYGVLYQHDRLAQSRQGRSLLSSIRTRSRETLDLRRLTIRRDDSWCPAWRTT